MKYSLAETLAEQSASYSKEATQVYVRSILRESRKQGVTVSEKTARTVAWIILSGECGFGFVSGDTYEGCRVTWQTYYEGNGITKTVKEKEVLEVMTHEGNFVLSPLPKNSKTMGLIRKAHRNSDAACMASR
jgi:hypothetical protein